MVDPTFAGDFASDGGAFGRAAFVEAAFVAAFLELAVLEVLGLLADDLLTGTLDTFGLSSFFDEALAAFVAGRVVLFASFVDLAKIFLPLRGLACHVAFFSTHSSAAPACLHMYGVKHLKAQAAVIAAVCDGHLPLKA